MKRNRYLLRKESGDNPWLFSYSWEQRKLSDIAIEVNRNDPECSAPIMMITANNGFIEQSERYAFNNAGESLKKYTLLKRGELAYNHGASKLRPYGSCFSLTTAENARIPFVYHCFAVGKNDPEFVSTELNGSRIEGQLRKIVSSGARMDGLLNISFEEYSRVELMLPSVPEQETLSTFFRSLDNLITLHQRDENNVAGMPENRLITKATAWEQRKLEELVERIVRKNTNNESKLPLTISAQDGLVDQITYFNNRVASRDVSNYYLVLNGEFAYNKSTSDGYPFGAVKRLDLYEKGVLSTLYIVFGIKNIKEVNSDFLTVFFDSDRWHKGVAERAAEGARNHGLLNISAENFFDIDLYLPMDFHHQLKGAIMDAVDEGLIERDPTRKAIIKGKTPSAKKIKYLNQFELHTLLINLNLKSEINYDWMILLIAKTGMRFSEALALTPKDFDFSHQTLSISKTWDYKGDGGFLPTKNTSSVRKIQIDWQTVIQFSELVKPLNSDEPIFVNKDKVYNSTVNDLLARHCKKAKLPVISIHGLRHTHASLLLFAGVSIASVARRLGHASMTTTQRTYLHIIQELENQDVDLVMRSISGLS